jgi:predicted RNA-binding Zn-ribbon protein involved in translation (DUF1610 family)
MNKEVLRKMSNKNFDKLYSLRLKEDERKDKLKVVCKCGWRNIINNRYGKLPCRNCGEMVYLDKRIEFMDKMKKVSK